jgi:hypothetical protein
VDLCWQIFTLLDEGESDVCVNVPAKRVEEKRSFEAGVSGHQLILQDHCYSYVIPKDSGVGTRLKCFFESFQGLFNFTPLQRNSSHADKTIIPLRINLQGSLKRLVSILVLPHLVRENAHELKDFRVLVRDANCKERYLRDSLR